MNARLAYLDVPFVALAHRGGFSPDAPASVENSLRAFQAAWALGYRYLETDVHTTLDGRLVAFHDDILDRVTDAAGRVAQLPWDGVREARIGGTEEIPLMEDLLAALPRARFNIDLKAPTAVEPLARLIHRTNAWDRVCVGSFSGSSIRAFRRLTGGRVATSASPLEVGVFALAPGLRRVWPLGAQAFQMPMREPRTNVRLLSRPMLDAAHARGAQVHVWTVNDASWMNRLIDLGVDGLVSDDLVALRNVLVTRDLWEGND